MTDSRHRGEEDYCTPGVKIIKEVECVTEAEWVVLQRGGVSARLSNADRTMDLQW